MPPLQLTVHYDNGRGFADPHLWIWYGGSQADQDVAAVRQDAFGAVFEVDVRRPDFNFKFKAGAGTAGPWEDASRDRSYRSVGRGSRLDPPEIWCRAGHAFVYQVQPKTAQAASADEFVRSLEFTPGAFVSDTGGLTALGANALADGRMLFGLFHPNAARAYVIGSFNDWQHPAVRNPDRAKFIELDLYRGYNGEPNVWLGITDRAAPGDSYRFFVQGGVARDAKGRFQRALTDPYSRFQDPDDRVFNNSVIVDPTTFTWSDSEWRTPVPSELILYELSVYGFTEGDNDIPESARGRFEGITERIRRGYFEQLGVNALCLMPLAEVPSGQGPRSLGYEPSLYFTVERDFGTPDDFRQLVDIAHQHGLAVILDQVFNHTSNNFNPLWKMILDHPAEESNAAEGGFYFSGSSPWGNRIDSWRPEVQNMLIDACKLAMFEYHVDGFRFDATHEYYLSHDLLRRLASEVKRLNPNTILIAENLPNQRDLNLNGYDGYAQWCDLFHDKIKALLREGSFGDSQHYTTDHIGEMFYFSKNSFATHTNNVVNYSESHDETSVPYEVSTNDRVPGLKSAAAKERKGRLGLLAALVALGQPMLYMGTEFNVERDRNIVAFDWPTDLATHGFYQWTRRLTHLRRRYPGLRMAGDDLAERGQFTWVIGPWLDSRRGGGRRAIGWRARPNADLHDTLVVLLNFENHDVTVDIDLGIPGRWVKLADIDSVNDVPPAGSNSVADPTALRSRDGWFAAFRLPSSSGFIYKWESAD